MYRPSKPDEPKNAVGRSMSFFIKVGALFTASASLYIAYTITTYVKAVNAYYEDDPEVKDKRDPYTLVTTDSASKRRSSKIPEGADVSSRYDDWARDYDKEVGTQEKWMLMGLLRKRLVRDIRIAGNVLEVGAGTGRNLKWYTLSEMDRDEEHNSAGRIKDMQKGVQSLTFVDKSPNMLALARNKWDDMFDKESLEGRYKTDKERGRWGENAPRLHWVQADVAMRRVVPRPPEGFDAVVQTMGLCSYADPVGALRNLGALVRQPGEGKKGEDEVGGSIHLLEHGKSHYEWLNKILDLAAPMHADRYGCWWNRDIADILRKSGLKIERIRRYHLGTTWEVILRPAESRKAD